MKHIELQRVAPADIEARSMELIGQELGERVFPAEQLPVVKRVIHTTADFEYADNLVFSAGAVEAGIAAIRQGCTIVTDTQMAFSGVNKRVLEKFGGRAVCFMSDPDVAAEAKARGETRATVSMERAARLEGPLVLAIGNAPTALVRACELIGAGELKPSPRTSCCLTTTSGWIRCPEATVCHRNEVIGAERQVQCETYREENK